MSDPASITLSPCPFCGDAHGKARLRVDDVAYLSPAVHVVICKCGACGANAESKVAAIAAWNTRAALAQPARAQAGITPAMRLAGATVLYGRHDQYRLPEDMAEAIYRAMAAVATAGAQARVAELVAEWRTTAKDSRAHARELEAAGESHEARAHYGHAEAMDYCAAELRFALAALNGGEDG